MNMKLSAVSAIRALFSLIVVLVATMLFSCENDMMAVIKLSSKDSIPDITILNVDNKRSEMGKPTLELTAPKMISFQTQDAYTEFPNGLKIIFFDSIMQPKSELTANYGISWESKHTMQARGNVVIRNFQKNQQLNTESLLYDLNTRKVSTDEFVKITTPDKIIMGKGMESDELFGNWVIRNVSSTIFVDENK
ncbi:MAG: LPS export ABC transporter periplasmic protein LptC [Lentimicrobiaceae bacterium]